MSSGSQTGRALAVEAEGLAKTFGKTHAVDGVDLAVESGSVYGVLGPNGAGKTTTIRILATLLAPDAGRASVFGYDVAREGHRVRQLIGVTGQYASLDEALNGLENVMILGRLCGLSAKQAHARAEELLTSFDLLEAARRPLKTFSGGMRRRLDLAASLMRRPPLIFLDEPTTGLDVRTRGQMWDTIRGLVAQGSTVILTTQYLDEADQLADRVAVIDRGRVVAEGTPDDLKAIIGTTALEITVADPLDVERGVALVGATLGVRAAKSPESRRITAPMTHPAAVTDLLVRLRAEGIEVATLSMQKPTLDEVFLAITGRPATSLDAATESESTAAPADDRQRSM